jgi:hypothetical protein
MAAPVDSAATLGEGEEIAVSDAQSDHRQGRQEDQPRDAAEYPAPPPAPYLAAEYPIHQCLRTVLDWTPPLERARETVLVGAPAAGGH